MNFNISHKVIAMLVNAQWSFRVRKQDKIA